MTEEILNEETAQETATSGYADIQPVDEQPKNAIESLLTAEEREAIKYLNVDKTIRSLKERMADVNETTNGIIKNAEDGDMLDAAIKDFTVEQIKAMDPITLHRIYTVEETDQPIDLDISVDGSDYVDFMRDYLVLRKETMEANEKFDAEIAKLEAEITEHQEEFDKAIKDFSNISNVVIDRMRTLAEESEDENTREMAKSILKAIDDALNLDTLKAFVKSYKHGNDTLRLFRGHKESMDTYNKCLAVSKKLGFDKDFVVFSGLENHYLPEQYHKRPNMFVFTIMHMVSTWKGKYDTDPYYGLLLTQLYVNLKDLYSDRFDTEEQKNTFLTAIMDVLDAHL